MSSSTNEHLGTVFTDPGDLETLKSEGWTLEPTQEAPVDKPAPQAYKAFRVFQGLGKAWAHRTESGVVHGTTREGATVFTDPGEIKELMDYDWTLVPAQEVPAERTTPINPKYRAWNKVNGRVHWATDVVTQGPRTTVEATSEADQAAVFDDPEEYDQLDDLGWTLVRVPEEPAQAGVQQEVKEAHEEKHGCAQSKEGHDEHVTCMSSVSEVGCALDLVIGVAKPTTETGAVTLGVLKGRNDKGYKAFTVEGGGKIWAKALRVASAASKADAGVFTRPEDLELLRSQGWTLVPA